MMLKIIAYSPGSSGHFLNKIITELCNELTPSSIDNHGSCHATSAISLDYAPANDLASATYNVREAIKKKTQCTELYLTHQFDYIKYVPEIFPEHKFLAVFPKTEFDAIISLILHTVKYQMVIQPSGYIGYLEFIISNQINSPLLKHMSPDQFMLWFLSASLNDRRAITAKIIELQYNMSDMITLNEEELKKRPARNAGSNHVCLPPSATYINPSWIWNNDMQNVSSALEKFLGVSLSLPQHQYLQDELLRYSDKQDSNIILSPIGYMQNLIKPF